MTDKLIERELSAAREHIDVLRANVQHAPKLGWYSRFAERMVRGGPASQEPAEMARPYIEEFEGAYSEITTALRIPEDFRKVEEAIENLNQELVIAVAPFTATKGGSQPPRSDAVPDFVAVSDGWSQDPIGELRLVAMSKTFSALRIYKLALDSESLQDKREALLPDFLRQAQRWDQIASKIEMRKRQEQLSKLRAEALPNLSLFTARDVPLPQVFARQRRFMIDLIADLEQFRGNPATGPAEPTKNRKDEVNAKIKELERELKAVQADPDADENSKRRRMNIISRQIDSLYEELESLYR